MLIKLNFQFSFFLHYSAICIALTESCFVSKPNYRYKGFEKHRNNVDNLVNKSLSHSHSVTVIL